MILNEKNVVITGSGRGIGKAVAIACAREGANVGLTSRTLEELESVKKEIEGLETHGKISIHTADITNYQEVEKAFSGFSSDLGPLHGVIANAGASRRGKTHEFDPERFKTIIDVNILGVFNTFKAAYPYLAKDDKKNKARFIITGSSAYPAAMPTFAAYTATKYAVVGFQKALSTEYKRENINFTMVLPTMVDTRLLRGKKAGDGNAPDNVLHPTDLEEYYLFLLSDDANREDDTLIFTNDFQQLKSIIKNAPDEKKQDFDTFKDYLEKEESRVYENIKSVRRLVKYIFERY
ncbi:MAG: SDR family NAD(P)-dependent oxidoreductase [Candidatus Lokiarchaeota archaeon]|nr:SDR family NAD(P)-dependent oxidoreductase [Candidatus Lokiarchaeota archaeon]